MKSEQSDTASVRYENTELLHHAFGSVGGSRKKAEPDFEFSEPITYNITLKRELCSRQFLMLCVIGSFCFFYIRQLNDRPNGI